MGGRIGTVGPAVVNDPAGRAQHEIDVAALDAARGLRPRVRLLGEAKYSARPLDSADLQRLNDIRRLLGTRGFDVSGTRLALFSANGFERKLATAGDAVELIDIERLYEGE